MAITSIPNAIRKHIEHLIYAHQDSINEEANKAQAIHQRKKLPYKRQRQLLTALKRYNEELNAFREAWTQNPHADVVTTNKHGVLVPVRSYDLTNTFPDLYLLAGPDPTIEARCKARLDALRTFANTWELNLLLAGNADLATTLKQLTDQLAAF